MALVTFSQVYGAVLLRVPGADPLLTREWVQTAYERVCDAKTWSHLRGQTTIIGNNQKTVTATATNLSPTLTAAAAAFAATDVGRQIRLSSIPVYTIIAVNTAGSAATLDQNYSEASGSGSFTVLDAYWTAPEDFWRFLSVLDPVNKWRLRWWVTEDDLNRFDPGRMATGYARALVSQIYSPVVADLGRPRYEVWPYVTSARSYPVTYYQKPQILNEDDPLIGPFSRGGKDLLVEGALAECALWPGSVERRNPYFNLTLADKLATRFQNRLDQLQVKDEDLYPTWRQNPEYPLAPVPWDSNWLQSHEPYTVDLAW